MICMFCGNRTKCFGEAMTDEVLLQQTVLCNYDDYTLADEIGVDDLIEESYRRFDEKQNQQVETA